MRVILAYDVRICIKENRAVPPRGNETADLQGRRLARNLLSWSIPLDFTCANAQPETSRCEHERSARLGYRDMHHVICGTGLRGAQADAADGEQFTAEDCGRLKIPV